jgi:D-3-phosphoglycerate dehydrogenase
MTEQFRVGLSSDFQIELTGILDPVLADVFDPIPFLEYEYFSVTPGAEIQPQDVQDYDAVITLRPFYSSRSLSGVERLVLISRWGVGYDMIEIPAVTASDVMVSITTDAVGRPVAEAIVTLLLALAKKLLLKEKLPALGAGI